MKKLHFIFLLILCALLTVSAFAADTVVFVASGGEGDGTSAESPLGSLSDAVTVLKDTGGTVVITNDYKITAATDLPAYGGTVTITSLYDGVDYRESGAALHYTAVARLAFGGATVLDNLTINAENYMGILAANFHPLKITENVTVSYSGTTPQMIITGGPNNDATVPVLGDGETSTLEILGGSYMQVCAFSRLVTTASHTGTMYLTIGEDVYCKEFYLGANNTAGAVGGTSVLTLKGNASIDTLYLSGSNASSKMNGSVTVNAYDNASVSAFSRYLATFFPNGTREVNIYGDGTTLPASLDTYFDTVNYITPADTVTLENVDADKVVSVMADGEEITATVEAIDGGASVTYAEALESFTLTLTVKDTEYTVYEYAVTETDDVAAAVLTGTKTYAGDVIYVGATSGNGLTPGTPCSSFSKAYEMLIGDGGTFVAVGEVSMARTIAPEHDGKLTVTSVYGGVDYRESGAKLVYDSSYNWQIGGETVFENITFDIPTTAVISGAFHPLTLDEGIEVINDYSSDDGYGLYLIGGHNNMTNDLAEYTEDTSITVRSGHIRSIVGFSRYCGARVHTGTANITVEGDAYVRYVFGGATQNSAVSKDTVINVGGNAIIQNLYTGGSSKDNFTTGTVTINISGGDIYEFDVVCIDTSDGKVTLYYDPRTVADGIVTMATMARFNVISTCEKAGAHTFGEAYANPFGGEYTAHTCEICGYTCLIETAPEAVKDGVIFVADGGFGDGLAPTHPLGSLEDAFNALGDEGGTIVLVGECTLPQNVKWKMSATHLSFQEPIHTGEVLVTSVYGGVDYREDGAKLIFDGNMHYRLSGPTTFNEIVFDTVGSPTTNLIAARYNKLVFGEDCEMLKTVDDGYQLWVVGGYQYFRYTDFIGVEIDDPYLEMVNPARPISWDYVPEELVDFTYVTGNGNTVTVSLEKNTAAAFEAMFADMEAEGLYVPNPSWSFRSAYTQYGIFSSSVGKQRVKGKDFATAYHAVEISASPGGMSEHQLGYAFDIYDARLEETYGAGNAHAYYDQTEEWQWIIDNAAKYGIIHRFLKTKTAQTGFIYEAWHFRYVGVEHAKAIVETDGYCLEEYVGEVTGMFAKDSSVTALSGSFYQIMGGSRGCDNLTFTGTNRVTVGESASVVNLVDVDEEVKTETDEPDIGEVTLAGDANGDGKLSLVDVIRILKYTSNQNVEISLANADMNGDSTVDIKDVLLVLKALLNG